MKIKGVWFVFLIALLFLLIFQSVWLYSTYNTKKNDLENRINDLFLESSREEFELRFDKYLKDDSVKVISLEEARSDTSIIKTERILNTGEMKEANMFQQVLELMGKHIEINSLDSLFNEKLADIGISNDYLLVYKDSVGNIIEQIGELPSSKIDKAFHTDALLIVDGKRVQAIMDVTPDIVFRQMIWLLVASFLMLFVLVFCVIYQAKTIFTQYKLNRLREDFVHALTHDMKTPLSTINNVLSQFRSGLLDNHPDMKERFGEIGMDQVAGLQMLVEKILTIAKLERGRLLLERSDTDLPGIVKELKERFAFSKDDKQVTIRSSCDLKDCSVYLDTTLIKDAIGNLIENAVKYSGKSVVIDVDCYIMDDRLFIRIRDNGFGISLKDQQKIFEKFERGTAVSRKRTKGFGLGLNYVKHVTEAHGGIVTLYSMENRGSEFTLVLPLD